MDHSTPGFPVLHYLPEFVHTYVHLVGDAIQSPYLLSPSSPPLNLSQHLGLFQLVNSLQQVRKLLELHIQHIITSWEIDGETVETMSDFIFFGGGSKITVDGDCSHEIKRHSLEGKL